MKHRCRRRVGHVKKHEIPCREDLNFGRPGGYSPCGNVCMGTSIVCYEHRAHAPWNWQHFKRWKKEDRANTRRETRERHRQKRTKRKGNRGQQYPTGTR